MAKERHTVVPASYLILRRADGRFPMLRRANSGYYDGFWSLPAGHVEPEEMPRGAMVREAKEEIGVTLHPEDVRLVHAGFQRAQDAGERVDFFFEATTWQGDVMNTEPHKASELRWMNIDELPRDETVPLVYIVLTRLFHGAFYSELGYNFKDHIDAHIAGL